MIGKCRLTAALCFVLPLAACGELFPADGTYRAFTNCLKKNEAPGVDSVRRMCAYKHERPNNGYNSMLAGRASFDYVQNDKNRYPVNYITGGPGDDDLAKAFSGTITNEGQTFIVTSYDIVVFRPGSDPNAGLVFTYRNQGVWIEPGQTDFFRADEIGDMKWATRASLGDGESQAWAWNIDNVKGIGFD